jgi:hypothetical protein
MALQKIIEDEGKVFLRTSMGEVDEGMKQISFLAYIKVLSVDCDKNYISATVNFSGKYCNHTKRYVIPVLLEDNAPNFIAQAYNHLKTLPEFAGAVDC